MKIRKKIIIGSSILIFLIIVSTFFLLIFDPITTTFNITVETERISYTTLDKNNSRLILMGAEIADEYQVIDSSFYGSIDLNPNVKVTIERVAFGPISIIIENENSNSIGSLYQGDNGKLLHKANDFLEVYIYDIPEKTQKGQTFIFSIDGQVNLGRSVNFEIFGESTALLRNGEIKMIGKSNLSNNFFEAGSKKLNLGDRLVFDEIQSKTFGFVTINENPGMSSAYRVTAKEARIIKPGPQNETSGYFISASLLDKFLKDRTFQGVSILSAALIVIVTLTSFGFEVSEFFKD